jgi:RHS repeat-associated protein
MVGSIAYDTRRSTHSRISPQSRTVAHLAYDAANQLTDINYADGKRVVNSYNALGQLIQMKDWLGTTEILPDALGRALEVTDHNKQTVMYAYNAMGQRTSITYPDDGTATYGYDALGRMTSVIDGKGNKTSYTYNAIGQMTSRMLPNKIRTDYAFDTSSRLSQMTSRSDDQVLDSFAYTYDPTGNMTRIVKDRYDLPQDSGTFDYIYDPLGRLTGATHGDATKTYTYDLLGNRLSSAQDGQITNYVYNELNQLIRTDMPNQSKHYEYDKRGNLAKVLAGNQIDATYTFDTQGMLSQAITPKGSIEHLYNALGKRTSSITTAQDGFDPQARIDYLLDLTRPYNDLIATTKDDTTQNFLWGQGLIGATTKDANQYYLHDHLGSPTRTLDDNSHTTAQFAFDEFGVPIIDPALALDGNTGAIHNPFGFTGYQCDDITDLYFAQARYYDANMGRFAGEDTHWNAGNRVHGEIGGLIPSADTIMQSGNLYAYCISNPLLYLDLNGRCIDSSASGVGTPKSKGFSLFDVANMYGFFDDLEDWIDLYKGNISPGNLATFITETIAKGTISITDFFAQLDAKHNGAKITSKYHEENRGEKAKAGVEFATNLFNPIWLVASALDPITPLRDLFEKTGNDTTQLDKLDRLLDGDWSVTNPTGKETGWDRLKRLMGGDWDAITVTK